MSSHLAPPETAAAETPLQTISRLERVIREQAARLDDRKARLKQLAAQVRSHEADRAMAATGVRSSEFEAHAASYFANGFRDIPEFLAWCRGFDVTLFEPNPATSIESGRITCTREELKQGKRALLRWMMEQVGRSPVDYFEFGVLDCATFNRVIDFAPSKDARFFGFDTFEGLPEPWVQEWGNAPARLGRDTGDLRSVHPPAVFDERAILFKGLFQDTLPEALEHAFPAGRQAGRPLFVNIDCDIYSGALYALTSMHSLLRSGDYVYLDEFFDALNEFAAFNDYVRAYNSKSWFVPVARAYDGMLLRVLPPGVAPGAVEAVDRKTTHFLDRMKAYVRARKSWLQLR